MPTKQLIQTTSVVLAISIFSSVAVAILNYTNSLQTFYPWNKIHSIIGAISSVLIYSVWYKYFEFIKNEQAKKSILVVGICSVVSSIYNALSAYGNQMVAIIIGVFFAVSYIFWIYAVLKHDHHSKAYSHTKNYIFCTLSLIGVVFITQMIFYINRPESFAQEITLISSLLYLVPWIFYFLFLKEIPNEKEGSSIRNFQEEGIIDANLE